MMLASRSGERNFASEVGRRPTVERGLGDQIQLLEVGNVFDSGGKERLLTLYRRTTHDQNQQPDQYFECIIPI